VSLDFPTAELQDDFRCQEGAFMSAMNGIEALKRANIELQVNCTVTKLNLPYLADLLEMALNLGAKAFHPFFLVPTGRGKGLESVELTASEYETTLNWIYQKQLELGERIFFKPTDAPHYLRIMMQNKKSEKPDNPNHKMKQNSGHGTRPITRGCLAGTGFCFISHIGDVQGCGYLTVKSGNVREDGFGNIWLNSRLFNSLRDISDLKGKCGICEYKRICGGCRARAFESTGDFMESEPYCLHQPHLLKTS
jgi:AdoMet-dependent heme synthase